MKPSILKSIYLLTLIFSIITVSCTDDFPFIDGSIPEGEGVLSATVTFTPTTANNVGATRTPGDTIKDIKSLCVLVYSKDGELIRKYAQTDLDKYDDTNKYKVDKDNDYVHDGTDAHTDETYTAQATFNLKDLPFGQYKMYAVANMGDLSKYDDIINTEEGLKNIKLDWQYNNIVANDQMFGYFTTDSNMQSEGFDAPLLFFKSADMKIHAWLKRVVSKVTVAFDPSGLNQGVTIYIRNVTLRDLPKTCLLGAENTPTKIDELYNHLSTPYSDPDYKSESAAIANSRFEYNSEGIITDSEEHTGDLKTNGLRLDNSIRSAIPADAHGVNAPSLFFFENNQTPYLEEINKEYKKDPKYDKRPQTDGDDTVGTVIHDDKDGKDFKDRVPYGTYVEVEAYYISSNPANPGEGSIKYRFMLGKDISFNYDAERNYHYKLTLGFNGWANDPDWHIDYIITNPDIKVPPVFRVSYLYHQMSELPIQIIGDIEFLTVTITENNWAPYDPNPTTQTVINGYEVPQTSVSTTPSDYIFQWNLEAFQNPEYMVNGKIKNEFGFLALHLPSKATTLFPDLSFNHDANVELIDYYNKHKEGERRFDTNTLTIGPHTSSYDEGNLNITEDDYYNVNPVVNEAGVELKNQRILMLPVWTRALNLIPGSGFSGNNPYEAFERKAVLHIFGQFTQKNDNGEKIRIERDVEVYQVKRITNPKGVWRAHDRSDAFNVTLLEAKNSNAESDFQPFISEGEWSAFIESQTNSGGFSIRPNGETNGYMENGIIHGNTGSEIHFAIDFGGNIGENDSECAIVKVKYHGNQCLHKILVRKGYNAPLRMGTREYTTSTGTKEKGRLWSSFSLYQATYKDGEVTNNTDRYDAVLTKNPLMLGSMFRRGRQTKGIFVRNNQKSDLGPFKAPGSIPFIVGLKGSGTDGWTDNTWTQIGYRDDREERRADTGREEGSKSYGLGTFISEDGTTYKVPSYDDFQDLTESSEFAYGVYYGSSATKPALKADDAYGLIDPNNEGLFDSENGMRGVVAYDKTTGNQIFFPMGRYGTGRRNNFILTGNNAGQLRYGDVNYLLTNTRNSNNLYRPIPYNLMISSGNIYWIDKYYPTTDGCMGWDMNYFNFDFNAYTANNWRDACPIKFVIEE